MVRCALAGVVLAVVLAGAGLARAMPQANERSLGERLPAQRVAQLSRGPDEESKPASENKFLITDETEVELDGRPCKYADVPGDAVVVLVELAADGRTVLKAHFRSRK